MKLCFLGNSHLTAFRQGWQLVAADHPDVEIDFFGAIRDQLKHLKKSGRQLVCEDEATLKHLRATSGGKSSISIDDYDGFVLAGLGLGLSSLFVLTTNHRSLAMVERAQPRFLTSKEAMEESARNFAAKSIAKLLGERLRSMSDRPIVSVAPPFPCPGIAQSPNSHWLDASLVAAAFEPVWRSIADELSEAGVLTALEQPPETMDGYFTKAEYGHGSVRVGADFDKPHGEDDFRHMNGDYGAIFLPKIIRSFEEQGGSAEPERRGLASWSRRLFGSRAG